MTEESDSTACITEPETHGELSFADFLHYQLKHRNDDLMGEFLLLGSEALWEGASGKHVERLTKGMALAAMALHRDAGSGHLGFLLGLREAVDREIACLEEAEKPPVVQ